jgi:hypothetical protein
MSEDVKGQCTDLVDPENLGVGFGISTLSSIERGYNYFWFGGAPICVSGVGPCPKVTQHAVKIELIRTLVQQTFDFRSARIIQYSFNATFNLMYFMEVM